VTISNQQHRSFSHNTQSDCMILYGNTDIIPGSPIVFLDRDGVLNEDLGRCVRNPTEFVFLPGTLEALRRLCHEGFTAVVISNQADVGRGAMTKADLEQIDDHLKTVVKNAGGEIALSLYCCHKPEDNCGCRKPKTGMLEMADLMLGPLDRRRTILVGDRCTDLEAGFRFGIPTILVGTVCDVNSMIPPEPNIAEIPHCLIRKDLKDAVSVIVETTSRLEYSSHPR
jgi:D-glycero-D-manno-heptose 1,7-bisphosphate phosphatase